MGSNNGSLGSNTVFWAPLGGFSGIYYAIIWLHETIIGLYSDVQASHSEAQASHSAAQGPYMSHMGDMWHTWYLDVGPGACRVAQRGRQHGPGMVKLSVWALLATENP